MDSRKVVTGVIVNDAGEMLITKRKHRNDADVYGGMWEHPGGKVESGETKIMALKRELREELDIEIDSAGVLFIGRHDDVHVVSAGAIHTNELYVYEVRKFSGEPKPLVTDALRWVTVDEAKTLNGMPSWFDVLRLYKRMLPR